MNRRSLLRGALVTGMGAGIAGIWAPAVARTSSCEGDGTPLQFMPRTAPDDAPLDDELEKYPRCPYCGMSRRQWHHSRHLVHYDDGRVDGTCSIHCTAIALAINLDLGPRAIYAADLGSGEAIKPLVDVSGMTYLVGSSLPGTMSTRSKMAFADARMAESTRVTQGGDLADFDAALLAAYEDMARDTAMIRRRRAERRARTETPQ